MHALCIVGLTFVCRGMQQLAEDVIILPKNLHRDTQTENLFFSNFVGLVYTGLKQLVTSYCLQS